MSSSFAALTSQIDIAAVVFTAFWFFFAWLIIYLQREMKREGYPLQTDQSKYHDVVGWPDMPEPKVYLRRHGHGKVALPHSDKPEPEPPLEPAAPFQGAPLTPIGDPMGQNLGPGAWATRADYPEQTLDGRDQIVPMRVATEFGIDPNDPDPRGMTLIAADGPAGTIAEIWVDRAEPQIRYYEMAVDMGDGTSRPAIVPVDFVKIKGSARQAIVTAITADQFKRVPQVANPDRITLTEEDQISAYYGGGMMYGLPGRTEPMV